MVLSGIDILQNKVDFFLKKRNFALVTSSATIDSSGIPVYQTIKKLAGKRMKSIWSLQHGFFLDKRDNMVLSDHFYWNDLDCEVKSLYGKKIIPNDQWLDGIDAIVIDVFDVGTRVYTFLNHLVWIMKAISGKGIDVILLDRPNPLDGFHHEGNISEEGYFSMVGAIAVPMRHGLTAGEFLGYALTCHDIDLNLEIVKIRLWKREDFFNGIWSNPSPNMPSFQTAVVYPGAVLFEGTIISEGRGTTRPFEYIGSPFLDNFRLIKELESLDLEEVVFIPIFFKPEFSKFRGEVCKGLLIVPERIEYFNSFQVYYEVLRFIRNLYPKQFGWKKPPYEFEYERSPMDMICGSDFIRKSLEKNLYFKDIKPIIDKGIRGYKEKISDFLLY